MPRTRVLSLALPALLAPLALALAASPPAGAVPVPADTDTPELVIPTDFPDPDVMEVDGTFHAYSTSSPDKGVVPHATAPSLEGPWTVAEDVFADSATWPSWIRTTHGFWAPDVFQRADGKFLMYFTARNDDNDRMCLGGAVADDPAGPFVPGDAPLVCDPAEGGAIDANHFVAEDGTSYLLYKNDGNAVGLPSILWLQRTDASGLELQGDRVELLRNDQPTDEGVIEAPTLLERDGRFWLFFSAGVYSNGGYHTGFATADSLTGPYQRAIRPLLTTEITRGQVNGPGGQDVLGDRIVFHGHLSDAPGRGMYVAPLDWDRERPIVRGSWTRPAR